MLVATWLLPNLQKRNLVRLQSAVNVADLWLLTPLGSWDEKRELAILQTLLRGQNAPILGQTSSYNKQVQPERAPVYHERREQQPERGVLLPKLDQDTRSGEGADYIFLLKLKFEQFDLSKLWWEKPANFDWLDEPENQHGWYKIPANI